MIPFKKLQTNTAQLNRIQDNIDMFSQSLVNLPILRDGVLIEGLILSTTETKIPHKLGREYIGYLILKQNAAEVAYISSTDLPGLFLNMKASGTMTVTLWVF